jgi:DNA (cytosine-5)-methyltransferase 1
MIFGSLFSGIGAPELAWQPLGWRCAWTAEIDPFACAVLRHRFPGVPNLGDVTEVNWDAVEPVELVVFGSPCQSFSVAGKRLGLGDPRGNLALVGLRAVSLVRPTWVVFENVPGLLSSDQGRDFGAFLGLLAECGYGFAYRILDAQFAGVPQRRRRVFVVGYLGDWRPAAAVLFESESLRGDSPPRRETGERIAPTLSVGAHGSSGHQYRQRGNEDALIAGTLQGYSGGCQVDAQYVAYGGDNTARPIASCVVGGSGYRNDCDTVDNLIAFDTTQLTHPANRSNPKPGDPSHPLAAGAHVPAIAYGIGSDAVDRSGEGDGTAGQRAGLAIVADASPALRARGNNSVAAHAIAFRTNQTGAQGPIHSGDLTDSLAQDHPPAVASSMAVRRLTPREAERLQGFPDDFTLVPHRGKPAADGPRYRALGNAMAVPVLEWIGARIAASIPNKK